MNIRAMERNFQEIEDIVKSIELRYIKGFDIKTYNMLIRKGYIKADNSYNLQIKTQDGEYIYVTASALMTYIQVIQLSEKRIFTSYQVTLEL